MVAPLGDVSPSGEMGVLSIFGGALIVDDFTSVIKILIALSAFSSILLALRYMQYQRLNSYEYVVLTIFSVLSMLLVTSSYDLISMYLAIELQSLSFYVLAASRRDNEFSTEAGLKYFVLGALSSGLLLFGESIIYGFTGITNFEELAKLNLGCGRFADVPPSLDASFAGIQGGPSATWPVGYANGTSAIRSAGSGLADVGFADATTMASLGLLFMLVAFLFKISAVPFHM
jgi:NADH-quinone oxidoreductase subunit N